MNKLCITQTAAYETTVDVFQSLGEEIANAISHGFTALLSIAGLVLMIVFAAVNGKTATTIVSVSIFGASLVLLYLTSCLYHALAQNKGKKVFQILDHCMIFVLITGTYTPICLSLVKGWIGWTVWGINVACSVIGITLNAISITKFNRISQILYIVMGWSIICAAGAAFKAIPVTGLWIILLGGIFYTVGTIFYRIRNLKYAHFVWHLFVMLGSIPHFYVVFTTCCF